MSGPWTDFVIAAADASAALAGLVIVAISVNITRIISFPHLPPRAAATIGTLLLILVASIATLIPQNLEFLGLEVLLFGIVCWIIQLWAARWMLIVRKEGNRPWYEPIRGIALGQAQTLPFIIAGLIFSVLNANGFYWIAGGTIAIFIFSMYNAWVLLVEILR